MFLPLFLSSLLIAANSEYIQTHTQKQPTVEDLVPQFSVEMSIDDINDMNIIINDDDCSDTFFQGVVDQLKEDGLEITVTEDSNGVNQNNATVVTLDQQYSSGPGTVIIAPYDNLRVGHSDSLALSMQAAFQQNGYFADTISCGQAGYVQDEDGNVHYCMPSKTESEMNDGYDSSFVTVSFGTQNQNPEWVAKSIENGLARQNYYLKSDDNQTDLIYRASTTDSIEDVADYFGTDATRLRKQNAIDGDQFHDSQAIVNPYVEDMKAFDKTGMFQIGEEKTRTY